MFTIKAFTANGHSMAECSGYRFVRGTEGPDGFLQTVDRLEFQRLSDGEPSVIDIGKDAVFVMNSHGKTVDSFQAYAPSDKRRWAVDPALAIRESGQGNKEAAIYCRDHLGMGIAGPGSLKIVSNLTEPWPAATEIPGMTGDTLQR